MIFIISKSNMDFNMDFNMVYNMVYNMIPNQPKFVVHYGAYRHTPTVENLINAPQIVEIWG